jgi:ABC-2 type transport system permease protein
MKFRMQMIGLYTLIRRELVRIFRIWVQCLLGPIVTIFLYFLIFGNIVGQRIGAIEGVPYLQFIAPGLIMLAVINSAYTNVASSFFVARFQRNIEEMLISPISHFNIMLGFVIGGIFRGFLVAIILSMLIYLFFNVYLDFNVFTFIDIIFTSTIFALMGFMNGLYAKSFDDIVLIPTFIITPMAYLGGVFYTLNMLPASWQQLASFNPLFYIMNTFRSHVLNHHLQNLPINYLMNFSLIVILCLLIQRKMKINVLLNS